MYNNFDSLFDLGLRPKIGHRAEDLFDWLEKSEMTNPGKIFDREKTDEYIPGATALGDRFAKAKSTSRRLCQSKKQAELKALREEWKAKSPLFDPAAAWSAILDADGSVRTLSWAKLPAEAMAFYRPFHFPPFSQWGIYLLIGPLLAYHGRLVEQTQQIRVYTPETIMHLILFEVFNHEFFHHLVESTATTLEIILAAQGTPTPLYLRHRWQQATNVHQHPHAPLEEALANAYAFNALSFISRVKAGVRTATVKTYQKAIINHWKCEPPGYSSAGFYVGGDYIAGGAMLLAHMLGDPGLVNKSPLSVVAKHVMPNGFMALNAKPDIPTWLVGSDEELDLFHQLVPAPNEAYTQLFWPYDTSAADAYIAQMQAKKKAEKQEANEAARQKDTGQAGFF